MSHMIDTIAYQNATPWHGLGNRVDYQQLEKMEPQQRIAEFQKQAGLDWRILERTISFRDQNGGIAQSNTHKALLRSDNGFQLSIVGSKYNVVQPYEIMQFFTDLLDSGIQIDVAGSLDDGKKVWCLATNNNASFALGSDIIKPYIQLVTSCDGSMATCAYYTSVRVVCNNTLQASRGDMKAGVKVSHRSTFNASDVKQKLGLQDTEEYASIADKLASAKCSTMMVSEVLETLLAKRDSAGEIENEKALKKTVPQIIDSINHSPGADLPSAKGTLWGLLNGITHYVDYKGSARNDNNRFKSSQFGDGAKLKNQAYNILSDMVA